MNKNTIIVVGMALVLAIGTVFWLNAGNSSGNLTDEEIKKKFHCDRVTTDVLKTDVYCQDPDLYRQHLREGRVIQE